MKRWTKYTIESNGFKKYISTSDWRPEVSLDNKNISIYDESLTGKYKTYSDYITNLISSKSKILSIGSGYARNEVFLSDNGYDITCTDVDFSHIDYVRKYRADIKYNLYNPISDFIDIGKYDVVISFQVAYLFNEKETVVFFENIYKCLRDNGLLIIDVGGGSRSLITDIVDFFQKVEVFIYYLFLKMCGKNISLSKKVNGYRSRDEEIVAIAKNAKLSLLRSDYFDKYTEIGKRIWLGRFFMKFKLTRAIIGYIGSKNPYIRMLVFSK